LAKVFVTGAAQADLDAIDLYSQIEFGSAAADQYHDDLLEAFAFIGEHPKIAAVYRRRKPIVRSWACGKHRIYTAYIM
jgi:plasmid stabilization system protein ParE